MRSTITPGLPQKALSEKPEQVGRALNMEVMPVLRALRNVANFQTTERVTATSVGTTWQETDQGFLAVGDDFVRIWTSPEMPTDGSWHVRATIVGVASTPGVVGRSAYVVSSGFRSQAGVCTREDVGAGNGEQNFRGDWESHMEAYLGVDSERRVAYLDVHGPSGAVGPMQFVAVVTTTGVEL